MHQKSELPEGWAWTKLEILTDLFSGKAFKKSEYSESGIRLLQIANVSFGHTLWDNVSCMPFSYSEKYPELVLNSGDILMALNRPILNGKLKIAQLKQDDVPAILYQRVGRFDLYKTEMKAYFFYYTQSQSFIEYLISSLQGVDQPFINKPKLLQIPFPLPPLEEQYRIVSAIEALFARLDATNEKLDRVPEILNKFRQSVLAAACDGRLTEAWREENKQNIGCVDLSNLSSNESSDDYLPSDYDPIIPQSIPKEWKLSRCYNLCDNNRAVTYGVIKLGPPIEDGIPTLRSSDVRWLKIDKTHVKCISPEIASNYSRTFLKGGEILVTVRGTLGGVAVVPQDMSGFNISREVAVIPLISRLNSHFFSYAIASKWSQNWLSEMTKGVAYTGINIKDLKNLPLPVPPLPEQQEIVRRVDALFAFADSIETKVAAAREKTEKLRQSILAKAFSGELVETEAEIARRECRDYETAEVLLERIKEERGLNGKKL